MPQKVNPECRDKDASDEADALSRHIVAKIVAIVLEHPGNTSYHDNTFWVPLPWPIKGIWLKPGQHLAVVEDRPNKVAPIGPTPPAEKSTEWDDAMRLFSEQHAKATAMRAKIDANLFDCMPAAIAEHQRESQAEADKEFLANYASGLDSSTRTPLTVDVPLVEPEQCARCAWMASYLRTMIAISKRNPRVKVCRYRPTDAILGGNGETCACGYSVLRGFNPHPEGVKATRKGSFVTGPPAPPAGDFKLLDFKPMIGETAGRCTTIIEDAKAQILKNVGIPAIKMRKHDTGWVKPAAMSSRQAEAPAILVDPKPTVVCLCGSTKFADEFRAANLRETLAGRIVLSIGCDTKSDNDLLALGELTPAAKAKLDELHKRKIDLADEVLILNVGGYVGSSTLSEIIYADRLKKPLRWLEPMRCPCCKGRGGFDSAEDSHECALCHGAGSVGQKRHRPSQRCIYPPEDGQRCDTCEKPATKTLSEKSSQWCADYFVGYYCDDCYREVEDTMRQFVEEEGGRVNPRARHAPRP